MATLPAFAALSNEIDRAVTDLGAPEHRTREAASQFLATAGKAAVPALEKAAQSPDPEVRLRAQELLPGARLGLPPDFPADLRMALNEYPKASLPIKADTVKRLTELGRPARAILIELAQSETNLETRVMIFGQLLDPIGNELERRLKADKLDDNDVSHILDGLDFSTAILPELTAELAPQVIQRFDTTGHKKAADDLFDRSYQQLEKLCLEAPKDPDRQNNIAWLCAVSHRRLDDGLKHIEQALAVTPAETALLDTQAELYFQKGDQARALELIGQCVKRSPEMAYFRKQQERMKKGDKSVPPPEPDGQ